MAAPKLESYIRKVIQPQPFGYIPLSTLKVKSSSEPKLECGTAFSRMLLSSAVQHTAAYGACGADCALAPLLGRIQTRISALKPAEGQKEGKRVDRFVEAMRTSEKINQTFISSLCSLLTYAPVSTGGVRPYPDGGYVVPASSDVRLIWQLSRRSYAFLYGEGSEVEFKSIFDVNADNFSTATIDFLTTQAAYKVSPLTAPPQARDVLLVYVWAVLAGVDRFGIYNPMWDVLYWGRVSDVPREVRDEIAGYVLKVS